MNPTDKQLLEILKSWKRRYSKYRTSPSPYSIGYRDAIAECIYDLANAIIPEDLFLSALPSDQAQKYLDEQDADSYNSTLIAHEQYY